ncbi:MAG TPA: murein biosynthesis integral membrane protein MurJ [Mariprofundaceae bacterium]|nr:murein biosynthesis integral membrane protein MurJ [Mariprofundaceae bacterium]
MSADKSNSGRQLLKTTGTVGSWTLVSRVLGFARDILIARVLGAGLLADAFFVAFKLPNFFRRLLAEGTLTVALVPVLAEERKKDEVAAHDFLDALAGLLLATLLLLTLLGMAGMPVLLLVFAPGFHDEPDRWAATLHLARWMFPYLAMITLAAMSWAVLNTYRRFAVAAASPALLNIALIFAAIVLAPNMENPAMALTLGVLLGGTLQLAIQFPALRRIGWTPRPRFRPTMAPVVRTLKLFGPAVTGVAAVQINILVGTILATLLPIGAVSYLYYSDRIVQLPLGLFGIAMSTALLPSLSGHVAAGRQTDALHELRQGLAWLTWITLPATVGILLLAGPIITTLFEQGRFTATAAAATAHALQAYGVGLMSFCWVRVLSTACYAHQDSKTPMRYAAASVAANILLAMILMWPLGYLGLALATSLASWLNAALLIRHLRKTHGTLFDAITAKRMLQALFASMLMLILLLVLLYAWPFPAGGGKGMQALWLSIAVGGGILTFLAAARLCGERLQQLRRGR